MVQVHIGNVHQENLNCFELNRVHVLKSKFVIRGELFNNIKNVKIKNSFWEASCIVEENHKLCNI